MADSEPRNITAQMGVAQGFIAANEPREATGFADRAVTLAQESGDNKALGSALTVGAVAYQKSGDYAAAEQRAKRALDIDPTNKAAMAVYQMSKGRSSGDAVVTARATTPAPAMSGATPAKAPPQATAATTDAPRATSLAAATKTPAAAFVGADTEKALKLTAEAGRLWPLDKEAALRLLDAAIVADARNAAARASRARARMEAGDAAGALEDADMALAVGPSAAMHALKGEAMLALGRKGDEMLAHFQAAAQLDPSFSARYQELIAAGGHAAGVAAGASTPDAERNMGATDRVRPDIKLTAVGAGLGLLAALVWFLVSRRRD